MKRLSEQPTNAMDARTKFKLGLQLFYQWGGYKNEKVTTYNQTAAIYYQATSLLVAAWQMTHDPIAGLMAAEAYNGRLDVHDQALIFDQMIADLAGSKATAAYLRAAKEGWHAEAPPARLVPQGNLEALYAVLKERHSLLVPGGVVTIKDKKWFINTDEGLLPVGEVPKKYKLQADYLQRWSDKLQAALQA